MKRRAQIVIPSKAGDLTIVLIAEYRETLRLRSVPFRMTMTGAVHRTAYGQVRAGPATSAAPTLRLRMGIPFSSLSGFPSRQTPNRVSFSNFSNSKAISVFG